MGLFDKPKSIKIDLDRLQAADLEYYSTTTSIDKAVMAGLNKPFDQDFADAMEKDVKFYFVVKTNRQYDVVPGPAFEEWIKVNTPVFWLDDVLQMPGITAKAQACKEHFVADLIKQHKGNV